ncbi:MAG TPA: hypothetical protein VGF18_10130 [Candidatus Tumulicola sp.]
MTSTDFIKYTGAIAALVLLPACVSNSGTVTPANAASANSYVGRTLRIDGRPVTAARSSLTKLSYYATGYDSRTAKSTAKYWDYTINFYGTYASVFNYPKNTNEVDTINNVGGQGCTNKLFGYGKTTFWIMAAYNQISEYQVGTKLLKSLSVSSNDMPSSCAMNLEGDLAVGMLDGTDSGDVAIFKKAKGRPKFYKSSLTQEYFNGYDDKGNLFFDGFAGRDFQLDELPAGSSTTKVITTSNTVQFPGSVQWDGKYMNVFDQLANQMYQYEIKGTKATLMNTITFTGSGDCAQTWIASKVVYCGDAALNDGLVFDYPAGGSPVATFVGNFDEPLGTVAAQK